MFLPEYCELALGPLRRRLSQGILDDMRGYVERYNVGRFMFYVAAIAFGSNILGMLSYVFHDVDLLVMGVVGDAAAIVLLLMPLVREQVALQIDDQGIFLGSGGLSEWALPAPRILIPWDEVAEVVVYRDGGLNLGVSRPQHAPDLEHKRADRFDKPAKACPAEGVTVGTSRWVSGWRLDQRRLRQAVQACAPGVLVVEYGSSRPTSGI